MNSKTKYTILLISSVLVVYAVIGGMDSGLDMSRLNDHGEFMKYDIWAHFIKEEEALFPEIEKFIPRDDGPTGVMLEEHEDLRKTNERFQVALARLNENASDVEASDVVKREGQHIISVLRPHIDKEDNILFMMVDMHLDSDQNRAILELFHSIDQREDR